MLTPVGMEIDTKSYQTIKDFPSYRLLKVLP